MPSAPERLLRKLLVMTLEPALEVMDWSLAWLFWFRRRGGPQLPVPSVPNGMDKTE